VPPLPSRLCDDSSATSRYAGWVAPSAPWLRRDRFDERRWSWRAPSSHAGRPQPDHRRPGSLSAARLTAKHDPRGGYHRRLPQSSASSNAHVSSFAVRRLAVDAKISRTVRPVRAPPSLAVRTAVRRAASNRPRDLAAPLRPTSTRWPRTSEGVHGGGGVCGPSRRGVAAELPLRLVRQAHTSTIVSSTTPLAARRSTSVRS